MNTSWEAFFDPRVVCVVGASADPSRIGGRLVRYSVESGFTGRIIPVNPRRSTIFGLPAVASLSTIDASPDWVVVAVPRDQVPEVVEQAGTMGARNVAVVASGFAELGGDGPARQQGLLASARRHGMRLLGPNSNGFINVATGAFFAFTPVIDSARPQTGDVAVVTQSAALGTYLLNYGRTTGLGIRHWVHTGNEADITLLEVAKALAERGEIRALALCFEVLRDLPALRNTLHALAEAGVAVGVLQAGTSPAGIRASHAHTAALIGDEAELLSDVFGQAGAKVAGSIRELAEFLQMAVTYSSLPAQPRVGIVTTSGGVGVLAADALAAAGLAMPTLSQRVQRQISSYAPFVHPANPVDTTAQVVNEPEAYPRVLQDCLDSGELDLVAVFIAHGLAGMHDRALRQLVELAQARGGTGRGGPALAAVGLVSADVAPRLQRQGVAVFPEPMALTTALRAHLDSATRRAWFRSTPAQPPPGSAMPAGGDLLDEWESKRLLRTLGAQVVPGRLVSSPDEAVGAAGELGYPVVLKLCSPHLPHKAAAGALRLDLWTPAAVRSAAAALAADGRDLPTGQAPLLVEQQVRGIELFVGCVRHPRLGLLVGIGPGGSRVEQSRAVRWHWAPLRGADVAAALAGGAAGAVVSDRHCDAVADLGAAMVRLIADPNEGVHTHEGVHTVEANPVILTDDGRAMVADALIELAGKETA